MRWLVFALALVLSTLSPVSAIAQPVDIAYRNVVDPVNELLPTTEHASQEIAKFLESSCLYTAPELTEDIAVWRRHISLHEGGDPILESFAPAWQSLDGALANLTIISNDFRDMNGLMLRCRLGAMGGDPSSLADTPLVSGVNEVYGLWLDRINGASDLLRQARQQANQAVTR